MTQELQWAIGVLFTLVVMIGGLIARDRQMTSMISTGDASNRMGSTDGDDKLHERINRMRDDLTNNYIRRQDFDAHVGRMEMNIRELRDDIRENNKLLAQIIANIKPSGISV